MLRRNWASETSKKWRIVHATTEESYDRESEFLVRCDRILRSWIREQLWSDPRSWSNFYDSEFQNFAALRFWIAAKYTEWYRYHGNVFERPPAEEGQSSIIFNNSKNLASFLRIWDLIFQRQQGEIWKGNRWIRRFNHLTSEVEVEFCIILVELNLTLVWWILREFYLRNGIWKNSWLCGISRLEA